MIDEQTIRDAIAGANEAVAMASTDREEAVFLGVETALAWVVEWEGINIGYMQKLVKRGQMMREFKEGKLE